MIYHFQQTKITKIMRIRKEVKKIIHQNIEEYALKVNKSSSTIKRWLYVDNKTYSNIIKDNRAYRRPNF